MRLRNLLPARIGYLGPRTLAAMLAVLVVGIVFYVLGVMMSDTTMKGVGVLFSFMGLVSTVALLVRWLIYREIG